jgi:hypothetical protein
VRDEDAGEDERGVDGGLVVRRVGRHRHLERLHGRRYDSR